MVRKETIELMERQREEEFKFIDADKKEILNELLENIGDPDRHIRDDLIYINLAHLIHDNNFDKEVLSKVLSTLLDEKHLFLDMENQDENSVLTRSFSSLQLVIILIVQKRDNLFDDNTILNMFDTFMKYFDEEKNVKGYDKVVGWKHSIAHAADVFDQFLTLEIIQETEMKRVFESVLIKLKNREYYFVDDEDERLVKGMQKAILRDILSEEYLLDYVERFAEYEKNRNFPEMFHIKNNVRNFLRTLYFSLINEEKYSYLTDKIKELLIEKVTLR